MLTTIEKTVEISPDRHLRFDIPAPMGLQRGQVRVVLLIEPARKSEPKSEKALVASMNDETAQNFETALKEAAEKTAWRQAHPEEFKAKMKKLRDGPPLFGGIDGVTYQRQIRDEWEDRLVKMGLSNNMA